MTITGGPTGGGFTLSYNGKTTQLPYSADAATVEAALRALAPGTNTNHPDAYGRVNPFNPCLPFTESRTCTDYVDDNTGAPFDDSPNWYALN